MNDHRPHDTEWSLLGLGTGTLASMGRSASVGEALALIDTMEELALNTIDTADSYGSGDCEYLLTKALAGRRERFRIITKAGYRHGNLRGPLRPLNQFVKKGIQRLGYRQCFDSPYLTGCVEQSLRRLKTDRVEAFLLHDPPPEAIKRESLEQLFGTLKQQGKVLMTGVSSGEPEVLKQAVMSGVCDLIECPANIDIAHLLEPVWVMCAEKGIHVVGNHVFAPDCLSRTGMDHERLMKASAALLPAGSTLLSGTRNPSHMRQSLAWVLRPMRREEALQLCKNVSGTTA